MSVKNICVIGMGFIGTTLAAVLAEAGFCVFGVEKNKEKLELLKQAKPHFHENGLPEILSAQLGKNLFVSEKIPSDKNIDAFIISVATPVDEITKKPDLSFVKLAVEDILPNLKPGQLVMLRSTVPVGTTRKFVLPLLEQKSKDIYLSFCPERTVEGKAIEELKTLPQIIGGLDEKSIELSAEIFSKTTSTIIKTTSLEAAEIVKLINNSYRDFNFAFANQVALICKGLGLDSKEVVESANLGYKRSNVAQAGFTSLGKAGFVGGVCLEKDPYILVDSSGVDGGLIRAARETNEGLIKHVAEKIDQHLKENNIPLKNGKIFVSGFAFKGDPETDDTRGSPAINLVKYLRKIGIENIFGHDFVVKNTELEKIGVNSMTIDSAFKEADIIVFMNNHKKYDSLDIKKLVSIAKEKFLLFDGWQLFSEKLKETSLNYESIGYKKTKNRVDRDIH